MSEEPAKRRWYQRGKKPPVVMSRVCPSCKLAGPKRLAPDQICATCEAQNAWNEIGESGIKIDQAAIDEALRRRAGEAASEAWWRATLVWGPVALSLAVAAFAAWAIVVLLSPREIGPLQGLLDDLRGTSWRSLWVGIGAIIVGVVALVRTRKSRHYRKPGVLIGHLLAVTGGAAAIVIGAFHLYVVPSSFGGKYSSMPAREIRATSHVDRIVAATVIVLAPDAEGDARGLAMGTGAIVGTDARRAWIVTCSHVAMPYAAVGAWRHAKDAQPVWVQLSDGREGKGIVKWAAPPPLDIAVVELPIENPPSPVPIARDQNVIEPGANVTFVPNPYRDGWLVHHGRLLRKEPHETPAGRYELLITDLPVVHGDSGSGLFDERGQLIGLNTWTKVEDGYAHGISLPADAMRVLADAVQHQRLDRLDDMIQE